MKLLIGITGGIGAGKSAVTEYLRSRGEVVICADETAKAVVQPGQLGAAALREYYGDDYFLPDGALNRKKLAEHVFGNAEHVSMLNSLLHPLIISSMYEQVEKYSGRVFLDAALLIQSGMQKKVDYVWLVVADMKTRVQRVMQRDNANREDVLRRINNQMSDDEMRLYADEVIGNNGTLEELYEKINVLLGKSKYTR
jgi:dephospho-CoA kinase